jgi:hypothetical protein
MWGSTTEQDHGLGKPGHKERPYLKNNQKENGWQNGSSVRVPDYQV